ncbi:hypothetical protein [Halorarius litoreus]|uniref:hypothetical protein n=1 Tax=Halorarius litoreus TaxID=2962676 RepID=UPI0020CBC941|nr:hypothetical protein [Halorarius litoreus]
MNELQSVIGFNEEMLDDAGSSAFAGLAGTEAENVTDQLLDDDEVTCWTCGSEVDQEQIESRIETLQERRETMTEEIETVEAEVEELESEDYSAVLDLHKEANQLEYELGKLETDLERVDSNVREIENRIAEQDEIESRLD